jgi:gamma-glutamylcyclotransferase (GGCT)/AIG2-like uncharacterized protein YtfP
MSDYPTPYVFVYDVFLKDAVKHIQIAPYVKTWARAEMPGKLYQLPTGLPIVVEEEGGKVFGEVMTFEDMDEVMGIIDSQEGYRADAPQSSRLMRELREVTLSATGEKVKAMVYFFPRKNSTPRICTRFSPMGVTGVSLL